LSKANFRKYAANCETLIFGATAMPQAKTLTSRELLASLAGHKSIATTQAYIDVNDEMKRAAVELVS
jgi:integrase